MVYFWLVLQQLISSSTHLVAQEASMAVPPGVVLLFRSLGASVIFVPMIAIAEKRWNIFARIERVDYGRMFLLGLLNVPLNQLLYLNGIKYTTPANSALLYALTPALVFLFTLLRHSERPSARKVIGILMAIFGAAVLMFEHGATLSSEHTIGNILIFIAVTAWSLYTMLGRSMVLKYGAIYTTGINMIIGTILYFPLGLLTSNMAEVSAISTRSWIEIGYLAAFASVVNYLLWFYALGKLETTKVAIFQNLQPVATTTFALILGRVILTTQLWGGGLITLAGVLVVQLG
jgi:drug/metabolite transporter (DMT)-like permease